MTQARARLILTSCLVILANGVWVHFGVADEEEVKRSIYNDCDKAAALLITEITTEPQKNMFIQYLINVLKSPEGATRLGINGVPSSITAPPPLGTPNRIGLNNSVIDEPKIGELISINNSERDQNAKRCALQLLPKLTPQSISSLPVLLQLSVDESVAIPIQVTIDRTVARLTAAITDQVNASAAVDQAVRTLQTKDIAAAQNILFEAYSRFPAAVLERLLNSELSGEWVVTFLQRVLSTEGSQTALAAVGKDLVKEGAKRRQIGVKILQKITDDSILFSDTDWAKIIVADFSGAPGIQALQDRIVTALNNDISSTTAKGAWIVQSLRDSLKGASLDEIKVVIHLSSLLITIPADLEADLVTASQKLLNQYVSPTGGLVAGGIPNEIKTDFENLLKKISQKSKWKAVISVMQPSPVATSTTQSTVSAGTSGAQKTELSKPELIKYKKQLKSKSAPERLAAEAVLFTIDKTAVSAAQSLELLTTASDCKLLSNHELIAAAKITPSKFYERALFCLQTAQSKITDLIELLAFEEFPKPDRQYFVINVINNQLFDRRFRAQIATKAFGLGVNFAPIKDSILSMIKDGDPAVWQPALMAAKTYHAAAVSIIDELTEYTATLAATADADKNIALMIAALYIDSDDTQQISKTPVTTLRTHYVDAIEQSQANPAAYLEQLAQLDSNSQVQIIGLLLESHRFELRSAALLQIAHSTLPSNQILDQAVLAQLNLKVSSVRAAALLAAVRLKLKNPLVDQILAETAFTDERSALFNLCEVTKPDALSPTVLQATTPTTNQVSYVPLSVPAGDQGLMTIKIFEGYLSRFSR